jgi:hypothetical protein
VNLQLVGDLLLLFGWGLPAIAAPIEYLFVRDDEGRRLGFRRSAMGRHLASYMGAVGFLAALGAYRLLIGPDVLWQVLRVVGFAALIFVTWWRWAVVHRARRASDAEHRNRTP